MLPSGVTFVPLHILDGNPLSSAQGSPSGLTPSQIRQDLRLQSDHLQQWHSRRQRRRRNHCHRRCLRRSEHRQRSERLRSAIRFGGAAEFRQGRHQRQRQRFDNAMPSANQGWAGEIELDVEWAHAIAPGANILLVEANSANDTDLLNAVNYARQQSGVVAVSMSWGGSEFSGEQNYDSHFTTPAGHAGVALLRLVRRQRLALHLAGVSTHVVGVGGTTLSYSSTGQLPRRNGWSGSGGGLSHYESAAELSARIDDPQRQQHAFRGRPSRRPRCILRCRSEYGLCRSMAPTAGAAGLRSAAPATRRRSGPP